MAHSVTLNLNGGAGEQSPPAPPLAEAAPRNCSVSERRHERGVR
jgi:hypothetical protein